MTREGEGECHLSLAALGLYDRKIEYRPWTGIVLESILGEEGAGNLGVAN